MNRKGEFWLPSNPDHRVFGDLHIRRDAYSELEVIGSFKQLQNTQDFYAHLNDSPNYELVCGSTTTGDKLTLVGVDFQSSAGTEILHGSFRVRYVLLGHHFNSVNEVQFNKVAIRFSNIEDWTRMTGFSFNHTFDEESQSQRYIAEYSFPLSQVAETADRVISTYFELNQTKNGINEIILRQNTYINISFSDLKRLDDIVSMDVFYLQNFFGLALGVPVYPIEINGYNDEVTRSVREHQFLEKIQIFYANKDYTEVTKIRPFDVLFRLNDVVDNLAIYIGNWFSRYQIIKPSVDLYSAYLFGGKNGYLEPNFLSICQALEAYHRRVYSCTYIPIEEYDKLYAAMCSAIPLDLSDEFKVSLREKMKWFNEYSLRKRLKELLQRNWEIYQPYVGILKEFVGAVVDTRNYHTHYGEELEERAKSGSDLIIITEKLRMILEICLLVEMGISDEKIKTIVDSTGRYDYLRRLNESSREG